MIGDEVVAGEWLAVGRAEEFARGGLRRVRVLGEDVVVWRGEAGLHAWLDLCVHRGAKLSGGCVKDGRLVCPYHGWEYAESGACEYIPAHPEQAPPAKARVKTFAVAERYGLVWVRLRESKSEIASFEEWNDTTFRKVQAGPYAFDAQGPRVIENFLDVGHFPFVHAGFLGDPERTEVGDYEVESGASGILAKDIAMWQPDPDGTGQGALVTYTYRVERPLTAYFVKKHGTERFAILCTVTPVDERRSEVWMILALNYAADVPDEKLREFQDVVSKQDIPIVESQRPELLPLDLQAELHLRSDRTAIAYRQWLGKLGMKYGTA